MSPYRNVPRTSAVTRVGTERPPCECTETEVVNDALPDWRKTTRRAGQDVLLDVTF